MRAARLRTPGFAAMVLIVCVCAAPLPAADGASLPAGASEWVEPATLISFRHIPGGTFLMGSEEGHENETPVHEVRVKDFYLGRYEVTQRQWRQVMKSDPSHFSGCDGCPVEQVSWNDVQKFLAEATELSGFAIRLPTEAEWEYAAAAAGAHRRWPGTDLESEAGEYVWFSGNFSGKVRPVGLKLPNAFSLFDMGGNVAEWCADWYDARSYRDPRLSEGGPEKGEKRVVRGGSWLNGPLDTRVARRSGRDPGTRSRTIGFRVALDAAVPSP